MLTEAIGEGPLFPKNLKSSKLKGMKGPDAGAPKMKTPVSKKGVTPSKTKTRR